MNVINTEPVLIRPATVEDTRHIAKIKVENHHVGKNDHPLDVMMNDMFVNAYRRRWEKRLSGDGIRTLVLSIADEISGFICYTQDAVARTTEITNIYLLEEVRGLKLGRLLCETAFKEMMEAHFSSVTVWIARGRVKTRRFYEAMGFKRTSIKRIDEINKDILMQEVKFQRQLLAQQ